MQILIALAVVAFGAFFVGRHSALKPAVHVVHSGWAYVQLQHRTANGTVETTPVQLIGSRRGFSGGTSYVVPKDALLSYVIMD